jgi:hypothetical protein
MINFVIRKAEMGDVPFLIRTIIEAEKSGTNRLSWTTIFGLSEEESCKYLAEMLYEGIDGCELSVSSFIVAEYNGNPAAALSAWAEGVENKASSSIKGDLLGFTLPKRCIERALLVNSIVHDIHIDYTPYTIQKGAGYVVKKFRHNNLFVTLTNKIISDILSKYPDIGEAFTQIYGSNTSAIKANEKAGFRIVMVKESSNKEIANYLPSNKKLLMKRDLIKI